MLKKILWLCTQHEYSINYEGQLKFTFYTCRCVKQSSSELPLTDNENIIFI